MYETPYVLRALMACPMHISMYISWVVLHACSSLRSRAWSPSLEKPATLAGSIPLLAPGPWTMWGFLHWNCIRHLVLTSGPFQCLTPILLTLQIGHLDGLMTNQPMITHNCGVMHLVSFIFGGEELGITQLRPKGLVAVKSVVAGLIHYHLPA